MGVPTKPEIGIWRADGIWFQSTGLDLAVGCCVQAACLSALQESLSTLELCLHVLGLLKERQCPEDLDLDSLVVGAVRLDADIL